MNDLTHSISITITGRYPHGKTQQHGAVTLDGNGDIDHFFDAFRSALVVGGFSAAMAARLDFKDDEGAGNA